MWTRDGVDGASQSRQAQSNLDQLIPFVRHGVVPKQVRDVAELGRAEVGSLGCLGRDISQRPGGAVPAVEGGGAAW
jgi:hypothetical protein